MTREGNTSPDVRLQRLSVGVILVFLFFRYLVLFLFLLSIVSHMASFSPCVSWASCQVSWCGYDKRKTGQMDTLYIITCRFISTLAVLYVHFVQSEAAFTSFGSHGDGKFGNNLAYQHNGMYRVIWNMEYKCCVKKALATHPLYSLQTSKCPLCWCAIYGVMPP